MEGHRGDSEAALPPDCSCSVGSLLTDLLAIKVVVDTAMGGKYLGNHVAGMGSHGVLGRRARQRDGSVVRESIQQSLNLTGLELQGGDGETWPWP